MRNLLLAEFGVLEWGMLLVLGAALVGMFVFGRRRQNLMQTQHKKMLDELRPGARVRTFDGVVGRIKEIREESPTFKTVLLQTGSDKFPSYVLFDLNAIHGIVEEETNMKKEITAVVPESLKEAIEKKDATEEDFDAKEHVEKVKKARVTSKKS